MTALLRPGRFDRRITIDRPDVRGREAVLQVHARGKPLSPDVELAAVARRTAGFSGADLANVVNEAALLAARRSSPVIEPRHLFEAIERAMTGPERRSRVLSAEDHDRIARAIGSNAENRRGSGRRPVSGARARARGGPRPHRPARRSHRRRGEAFPGAGRSRFGSVSAWLAERLVVDGG